ncbi:MAG: helix-turn-helix transcriptional regulator [Sphaerochaetaceae bacterium]|nr:helix-turn-helix transcriptional regulator [Sphaerochaetaceae bacterium]
MESVILFIHIFLFSIGCIGSASMLFLHTCLKMKLTRYFSFMFLILLFSLGRILIVLYLQTSTVTIALPAAVEVSLSVFIALSIYLLGYLVLVEIDGRNRTIAAAATSAIIAVQAVRSFLYYNLSTAGLFNLLDTAFIFFISAYLFLIGVLMYRVDRPEWNRAAYMMVRQMGLSTLIFAPLSAVIYTYLDRFGYENTVSLDFIIIGSWGLVVSRVLIHYLATIGRVPLSEKVEDDFISTYGISKREKEVIDLIVEGYTNKEIGEKLFISFTTARTHVSHIFEKTGTRSRVELVSKVLAEKEKRQANV